MVLAFFWASFLLWRLIRLTSYKEEDVFDCLFLSLFFGFVFGRLTYVLFHLKEFGLDLLKIILVNGYPGISVYGLLTGIFITIYIISYFKKIKYLEIVDYFITPAFIALAIGKIGAFFAGVEVGITTKIPIAVKYVGYSGARHLTPLYEGIFLFIAAYFSYKLLFEIRREKYFQGFLLIFFGFIYSLVYIIFDIIRDKKEVFIGQNINLIISTILLLTTTLYFLYYFRSPIIERLRTIINFIKQYGQKVFKNIASKHPKKTRGREKKDNTSD